MKTLLLTALISINAHAVSKLDCTLDETGESLHIELKNQKVAVVTFHDEPLTGSYVLKKEPMNTRLAGYMDLEIKGPMSRANHLNGVGKVYATFPTICS